MGFFSLILDINNKPKKKGIESNPKDFKVLAPPTKKNEIISMSLGYLLSVGEKSISALIVLLQKNRNG